METLKKTEIKLISSFPSSHLESSFHVDSGGAERDWKLYRKHNQTHQLHTSPYNLQEHQICVVFVEFIKSPLFNHLKSSTFSAASLFSSSLYLITTMIIAFATYTICALSRK